MLNGSVFRDAGVLLSTIPNEKMLLGRIEGRIEGMLQDRRKKPEIVKKRPRDLEGSDSQILDDLGKISIEAIHTQ